MDKYIKTEEELAKIPFELKSVKGDRKHFPSINQLSHCWQNYNAYVLCLKKNDSDEKLCKPFRNDARTWCTHELIEQWDEERESGKFLGIQEKASESSHHH